MDLTKPVQVFILLGQSNRVGLGKVSHWPKSATQAPSYSERYEPRRSETPSVLSSAYTASARKLSLGCEHQ